MSEFRTVIPFRVQWRDLDPLGHVNNAVYFSYLEQARIEYYERLFGPVDASQVSQVVAEVRIRYRAPAFFGETLEVALRIPELGNSSYPFVYQIREAKSGRLVLEAETVQVAIDRTSGRPVPLQDELRRLIGEYEGIG